MVHQGLLAPQSLIFGINGVIYVEGITEIRYEKCKVSLIFHVGNKKGKTLLYILTHQPTYSNGKVQCYIKLQITGRTSVTLFGAFWTPF